MKLRLTRALFVALALLLGAAATKAIANEAQPLLAQAGELVAFNTQSLKYHCRSCKWAIRCTKNCIIVPRSTAVAEGGVACKVCGGSCR